jgi:hypothetical protein
VTIPERYDAFGKISIGGSVRFATIGAGFAEFVPGSDNVDAGFRRAH